jgi:hypothetical protein
MAIQAVTDLDGNLEIKTGPRYYGEPERTVDGRKRFAVVDIGKYSFYFRGSTIGYSESGKDYNDHWGFDLEEKWYFTSNDVTKISFSAGDSNKQKIADKITQFLNELMAGEKPIPRFSLTQMVQERKARRRAKAPVQNNG